MYVDFPSVMLMIMGLLLGYVIGMVTRSWAGLTICALLGLLAAVTVITIIQHQEIKAWQYAELERIRGDDCRIAAMIKAALADRTISRLEYYRIEEMMERNALVDARDSLAQVTQRQCVTN